MTNGGSDYDFYKVVKRSFHILSHLKINKYRLFISTVLFINQVFLDNISFHWLSNSSLRPDIHIHKFVLVN